MLRRELVAMFFGCLGEKGELWPPVSRWLEKLGLTYRRSNANSTQARALDLGVGLCELSGFWLKFSTSSRVSSTDSWRLQGSIRDFSFRTTRLRTLFFMSPC